MVRIGPFRQVVVRVALRGERELARRRPGSRGTAARPAAGRRGRASAQRIAHQLRAPVRPQQLEQRRLRCVDWPGNHVGLSQHRTAVLAVRMSDLSWRKNPPASRVPVVRPPNAAVLTSPTMWNACEANVSGHHVPIRCASVRLLPKPTDLASAILTLCTVARWDPDRVEPFPTFAVRTEKMSPGRFRAPIFAPLRLCIRAD